MNAGDKTLGTHTQSEKTRSSLRLLNWASESCPVTPRAQRLFSRISNLPLIDLHTHYDVNELLKDTPWESPTDAFLGRPQQLHATSEYSRGFDHYLAQLMLKYNVPDDVVFGGKSKSAETEKERFLSLVECLKSAVGSDRYIWFCASLSQVFDLSMTPISHSPSQIWDEITARLKSGKITPCSVLEKAKVEIALTTDDPTQDLSNHQLCTRLKLLPTWRPDNVLNLQRNGRYNFNDWIKKLEACTGGSTVTDINSILQLLRKRLSYFQKHGCVVADVGFSNFYPITLTTDEANLLLKKCLQGNDITLEEQKAWQGYMLKELLKMNAEFGLRQYLHQGAARDTNTTRFQEVGVDTGGDGQGERICIEGFRQLFDELFHLSHPNNSAENMIAPTIIFPINRTDFEWIIINSTPFCGSSQCGVPKIQLGPPWWWNDSRSGIREVLRYQIQHDGLSHWIGMASDARNVTSVQARFSVFRAILTLELARDGVFDDLHEDQLFEIAEKVAYSNAKDWLRKMGSNF